MSDGRPHVLIVDDSTLVSEALRLLLEETGHRTSTAATVAQAVARARDERPDVMLLDLTLGRENGLDVLAELACQDGRPRVTVAVTGHDAPEVRERCLAAGCREVLLKPIAATALPTRIREWLAGCAVPPTA